MPGATASGMLASTPMRKLARKDEMAVALMKERLASSCTRGVARRAFGRWDPSRDQPAASPAQGWRCSGHAPHHAGQVAGIKALARLAVHAVRLAVVELRSGARTASMHACISEQLKVAHAGTLSWQWPPAQLLRA